MKTQLRPKTIGSVSSPSQTTLIRSLIALIALSSYNTAVNAENLPGQKVEDNSGNLFMEEVVDTEKAKQEELRLKKKSSLERSRPTDAQLQNVGVQVTPSGSIIPLINRGAPPVKQMGTRFTSSFEPIYPGYIVVPGNAPINNGVTPQVGVPYGGISPYGNNGIILNSPGYSYTWESTPGAPITPPASVITEESVETGGFFGGYAGRSSTGGIQGGAILGLPSTTQINSTTTLTPIPPGTPVDPN